MATHKLEAEIRTEFGKGCAAQNEFPPSSTDLEPNPFTSPCPVRKPSCCSANPG